MPTYEELKARAGKIITTLMNEHEKAPDFGQYNRLLGKRSTSKKDVVKAAVANIKLINQVSQMLYQKDVVTFEDEVAELPNMSIND
tara:strand:- start:233 stop:490 length:258 start_codon:yes stop_codon:yes gene_type:complete